MRVKRWEKEKRELAPKKKEAVKIDESFVRIRSNKTFRSHS